jgi:hypothetical protein
MSDVPDQSHRDNGLMSLHRVALVAVALVMLAGCSKPNRAADFEEPAVQPVVTASQVDLPSAVPSVAPTTAPTAATPKPKPKATTKPAPKATTDEPEVAYYANCSEVRAAGADPIRVGDPGYSRKLDRDGDGVACES